MGHGIIFYPTVITEILVPATNRADFTMTVTPEDIFHCVLIFMWLVYIWESYLSNRQVSISVKMQ